ncbi:acetylxylan esterase [Pedobacter glucosidilyticus]|uniref:acetylxylan esterase n=1 Tax=Pedobacter glucosidilyticus TaxID=1122941 RepID=UPI0026ECDB35|nr:acetylxylan esterase [Pedobacter glucosidilyticus]
MKNSILKFKSLTFIIVSFLLVLNVQAQTNNTSSFTLVVTADKPNWIYQLGEQPKFKITALQDGKQVKNIKVKYELGPEKMPALKKDSLILTKGEAFVNANSLTAPGFLRITVTAQSGDKIVKSLATAAFAPETIKPTITLPDDFNTFWANAIKELEKVPFDAKLEPLKERSTATVDVYQLNIQNIGTSRIYGILCVPKKEGKYPAVLKVPGAGVRPYNGDIALAEKGFITLEIGIHGIPVNLKANVYDDLRAGALAGYAGFNLDNKNSFYYKRVYLGCIRALDYLANHPAYDGTNLAVQGGSQGGALSIVTAALDKRIKYLVAFYPALSDVTGYLFNRAGGWPHYFNATSVTLNNTKAKLETCQYYDVVNFAKQLKVPGFYSWGFNDETCPPTSMYAAYNSISAPKELAIYKESGHRQLPEQKEQATNWLIDKLKKP